MAVVVALGLDAPLGEPYKQIIELPSAAMAAIHAFAPYAYAQNPSARLEVNTANGTLMSNQPFVDTYYIAGTYTTRVERFSTEAETPNISMVTDNYNRIRVVNDVVTLPTGDVNNFQYPLTLDPDPGTGDQNRNLRAMTRQDFIDTFVQPALDALDIWAATTNKEQAGTYYLTTTASPAGASLVSATPVAVNSEANIAAYSSAGIPEATKQTIDTNYYLAMVDPSPTVFDIYDSALGTYDLPLYFDAGTESIRQHSPTTWANLLGPWLRYYLATPGSGYQIEYNLTGGTQRGSTYVDTRVTPTGTGYTTLYVNTNDYRTQEFPTGTASTITANTKRFYINRLSPTYAATANPSTSVDEGNSVTFTLNTTNVLDGTTFAYAITGITAADISSGFLTGTVTTTSGQASTTITLKVDDVVENETATCTFTTPNGARVASVSVVDVAEAVALEGTALAPELPGVPVLSDGSIELGWTFDPWGPVYDYNADRVPTNSSSGHTPWRNTSSSSTDYYMRVTIAAQSDPGSQTATIYNSLPLGSWYIINGVQGKSIILTDNRAFGSYGAAYVDFKVEIASDAAGTNILATGYYRSHYEGGA